MTTVMLELNLFYHKIPLTLFQSSVGFHIETSHYICIVNQMTGKISYQRP